MVSDKNLRIAKVLVVLSASLSLVMATAGFGRAALTCIPSLPAEELLPLPL